MDAILPIAMCLCGGLGASARYVCDSYIKAIWHNAFPLSTFIINVIAGLLAGIVAALSMESAIPGDVHFLLATGFLGGFSTFSTKPSSCCARVKSRSSPPTSRCPSSYQSSLSRADI